MLAKRIEQVLKTLTYREREIIKLRYGIGDGYTYTLEEVGRIFKVTRERVRQVEAKAIRKLQHPVRARKLQGFVDCPDGIGVVARFNRRCSNGVFPGRVFAHRSQLRSEPAAHRVLGAGPRLHELQQVLRPPSL
jgi:DNA-binding CsgD family transcriptional regulator